jgi:hypothetical protein
MSEAPRRAHIALPHRLVDSTLGRGVAVEHLQEGQDHTG